MKCLFLSVLSTAALAPRALAMGTGRPGYGLIGYGITMYKPACASACRDTITGFTLDCSAPSNGTSTNSTSGMDDMPGMNMRKRMDMDMDMPTPECYATNDAFLQTLAWCIQAKCDGVEAKSTLEAWWEANVAGRLPADAQPAPKESFQGALMMVKEAPTEVLHMGDALNKTALVADEEYILIFNADTHFEEVEMTHETYAIALIVSGSVLPIAFSLLRLVPFPKTWRSRFYAYVIDPPALGSRHAQPILFGTTTMPTRGQAIFVLYIIIINIVLSAVGYSSVQPNAWYATSSIEIATYVANRTGVLSFANLPLLILYAGRNNVLLWVTNWSHSTFLLLHRWVAFFCAIQACIHSAVYLQLYLNNAGYDYTTTSALPFWIWGIVGTLALAILLPASILQIRRKAYEIFLAGHIVLALMALVGCYQHIFLRFAHQWGYEVWLYAAAAIWAFDRVLRVGRWLQHGIKRAHISEVDDKYLRIDIPGVAASGHIYLHFPTLTWRLWENHPFSVAGLTHSSQQLPNQHAAKVPAVSPDEKSITVSHSPASRTSSSSDMSITSGPPGVTLFVRRRGGLTSLLASKIGLAAGLPVLVEASYSTHGMSFMQNGHATPFSATSDVIFLAGGVGITAILPYLSQADSLFASPRRKLFWGVSSAGIVNAVEECLGKHIAPGTEKVHGSGHRQWGSVDVDVQVGERFALRSLLEQELGASKGGRSTVVVVCGPATMTDEVRTVVASLARHGTVVGLYEESFAW